jgi:hypothetical protein
MEVLYIAGLGVNLFSIGAATANGLVAHFEQNKVPRSYIYTLIKVY